MAHCVGVLATKPDDTGLILGTHMVEGENWFGQVVVSDLNRQAYDTYENKYQKEFNKGRR